MRSCLILKPVSVGLSDGVVCSFPFLGGKLNFLLEVHLQVSTVVILSAVMLSSSPPVFFRSPSQAKERAGVFGAGVGPAGDPLVLQVQHFCGTGPVCGAAPLELWHPPQRG